MIGFSHAAATDMPFAAMLTIAMVFAARLVGLVPKSPIPNSFTSFTSSPSFTSCFFGFFLGLAVLAKGPAAIILSGGSVLLWAIFTKRWRDAFRCLHPVAIASFCLTALPWYILCARRNPDFFRVFIIEHNFKRYLTPEFQHIQPFWFYVPIVLVAFVPWTLLLLWSVAYGFRNSFWKTRASSLAFFFLTYAVFCLVFFSASQSKLPGYILPAIPPIGLLLSRAYVVLSNRQERSLRWFLTAFAILALPTAIVLIAFAQAVPYIPHDRWGDDRDRLCPTRFRSRKLASHSQRPTSGFPLRFNRGSACLGPATDVPLYFPSVAAVRSFR